MPADSINAQPRHHSWPGRLGLALMAAMACRAPSPTATTATPPPAAHPPVAPAQVAGPPTTPEGRPLVAAESVDADTIRVKTLFALRVEANEIRCPRVTRAESAPVPKDPGPWLLAGDLVETDLLMAHSVSARLIIADEIAATQVVTPKKLHRWAGAGGPGPVRNRVTVAPGFEAPSAAAPSF